jgi:hypothetical protein
MILRLRRRELAKDGSWGLDSDSSMDTGPEGLGKSTTASSAIVSAGGA